MLKTAMWRKWGPKTVLSVVDQGIFSGANFLLNIFLVRWIIPEEYGIFAIAFSVFLFLSSFHQAFILEPMSVIGAAHYQNKLSAYIGVAVWIHIALTFFLSLIVVLAAVIMAASNNLMAVSFFGLAVATPLLLFFWLFRQACYLQGRPSLALGGSLMYSFFLFLGLIFARWQGWLSPFCGLFIMGFASLLAALMFWPFLRVKLINFFDLRSKDRIKDILTRNWCYGRWGIGVAFVNWLSMLIYLPLVGLFAGLPAAGAFRAMQNMILPLRRMLTGPALLFIPWLSRQRINKGQDYLKSRVAKFTVVSIAISCIYVVGLLLFGRLLVKFLYGEGYYNNFIWLLPYMGLIAIVESIAQPLAAGLKASERPDAIFWTYSLSAVFTLTLGIILVRNLKLYGAALGSLATIILITMVLVYFFWSHLKKIQKKSSHVI